MVAIDTSADSLTQGSAGALASAEPEEAAPPHVDIDAVDKASPIAAVRLLFDEARMSLDAEIALAKTVGRVAGLSLQRMAVWGTVALLFSFVGLLTLAVGLTIALAGVIDALAAALTVGGILFAVGLFAGFRARSNAITLQKAARMVVE